MQPNKRAKAQEPSYRVLFDALPIKVWTATPSGELDYANRQMLDYLGCSFEALAASGWQRFIHPEDLPLAQESWAKALGAGEDYRFEFRLRGADGRYLRHLAQAAAQRDAGGSVVRWLGTSTDIEAQRLAEEQALRLGFEEMAKREAEAERLRLYELLMQAPVTIAVTQGPDHVYDLANPLYCRMLGVTEPVGRPVRELLPELEDQGLLALLDGVYRSGEPFTANEFPAKIDRGDGRLEDRFFRFTLQAVRDRGGTVTGLMSVAVEVTEQVEARRRAEELAVSLETERKRLEVEVAERERTEAALREAHLLLEAALSAGGVVAWVWDIPRDRLKGNAAFARLFSVDPQEAAEGLPLQTFIEAIYEDDRGWVLEAVDRAVSSGEPYSADYRVHAASGEIRWVAVRGHVEFDAAGKPMSFPGVLVDITERKQIEEALRESETRLRFTLDAAQVGEWYLNLHTGSARRSLLHDRIFGYESLLPEWSYETFLNEHVHPEDRASVNEKFQRTLETHEDWEFECRIIRTDGEERWIWARGSVYHDASGKPTHLSGLVKDITDERRAARAYREAELEQVLAEQRRRIGQELHDGIRQELVGIGMLSNALQKKLEARQIPEASLMAEFTKLVADTNMQVRRLIHGLVPISIEADALLPALERASSNIEQWYGLPCRIHAKGPICLRDAETANHLFHIVQEAMTNAARHSRGSQIDVFVATEGRCLTLSVLDDGSGLPDETGRGGMGLKTMAHRAQLIGAELRLAAGERGGTTVTCVVKDA